jgi:Arylsulfotransferase (ASST)
MKLRIFGSAFVLVLALAFTAGVDGQPAKGDGKGPKSKGGVSINDAKACKGYTLVAPASSTKAHLIDLEGRVVHTWECGATPALSTYLLDNGNLLRPCPVGGKGGLAVPGAGGRVQEFDWDGKVVWDYKFDRKDQHAHHDITRMPNGNILMIITDRKSKDDVIAAGRRPETAASGLMVDGIIEVKKTGKNTGEIVWEWCAWDHLIQDHDKTKPNFGKVNAAPERIDVNYGRGMFGKGGPKKDDLDKLKGIGYLGGPGAGGLFNPSADWMHTNCVAYNEELDQIMISVWAFNEFWIIDHSTTMKEAAGKTGGKHGKGGDLLYRWGNPQAYRSGTNADQRLFGQHNTHWIPKGLPGAGNILAFNNGGQRPDGNYSSVDEIVLPLAKDGSYERKAGVPFGPSKATWSYNAEKKSEFFAPVISGAHRLPNGNTLVCSGPDGTVFEVTPEKEIVWKFVNPQRGGGFGGGFGGFFFTPAQPGVIMPKALQPQFKFTPEQEKQLEELQKEVTAKLEKIMTDEQREQMKKMNDGGFAGKGKGPGGGFGGMGGGSGGLFRTYRYSADHPAFKGRTLTPGKKIEEL